MADSKKYYWLKLKTDFFSSKRIKKLRKMAGGDTYTIIYLKMQLSAIKTEGILHWTGIEDDFAAELALDLDENTEDVQMTLMYLTSCGLIETSDNVNYFLPYAVENTGGETGAAERMRKMRERNNVTPMLRERYTEIEIEKEKDIEKEIEIESVAKRKRFSPPTIEEVQAYCSENNYQVDPVRFVDYYTSNGWMVGKNHMKDWKAAVRTWALKDKKPEKQAKRRFVPSDL